MRLAGGSDRTGLISIVRAIDDAGLRILEIRQHEPTLDDVFLLKTGRTLEGSSSVGAADVDAPVAEPVP